eukprot:sb/3463796/
MKDGTTQTDLTKRKRKKSFLHSEEVRVYVEELRVKYGLSREDVDDILDNGPTRGTKTTTIPARNSRTSVVPISREEVFTDCPVATSTQNPPVSGNQNQGSKNCVNEEGEINLGAHQPSPHVSLESVLRRAGVNKENLADLTCSSIEETPPESNQQPSEEESATNQKEESAGEVIQQPQEVGSPKEPEEMSTGSPNVATPEQQNSQDLPADNQGQQESENMENQEQQKSENHQEDSQDSILNLDMLADQVLMSLEDGEQVMLSETQEENMISETQDENLLSEPTQHAPPCLELKDSTPTQPEEDNENPREKIDVVMVLSQPVENGELVMEKSPRLVTEETPEKTPIPEIIDVFSQTQQDKTVVDVLSQQQDDPETNLELIFIDSQEPSGAEEVVVIGDSPTTPPGLKDDSQKSSEDIYATPETSPVVVFQTPEREELPVALEGNPCEREESLDTSVHVLETVGLERATPNNKQIGEDGDNVREDGDTFVQGPVHVVCDDQIVTTQSLPSPERPLVPVTRVGKRTKIRSL